MRTTGRQIAILGTISLVASVIVAAPAYAAPPGVNEIDDNGDRVYTAPYEGRLATLNSAVTDITSNHPEEILGTAFTSDRTMIEVFVTNPTGDAVNDLEARLQASDFSKLRIVQTENSYDDFISDATRIAEIGSDSESYVRSSLDVAGERIVIGISKSAEPALRRAETGDAVKETADLESETETFVEQAENSTGMPVSIEVAESSAADNSRRSDSSPFTGGAEIRGVGYPNLFCSTAIPLSVDGVSMMVTAGHCWATHSTQG